MTHFLDDVVLAIATFRGDIEVLQMLETALAGPLQFNRIFVVDSLGDGTLAKHLKEKFPSVEYSNSETNLGSAGNLERRLRLAAQTSAPVVFAINHDGILNMEKVAKLAAIGRATHKLGAVYPLRNYTNRGQTRGGSTKALSRDGRGADEPTTNTLWNSSNGSLYGLEPVRQGILPRSDLWMGWEDLGYGHSLESAGFVQLVANEIEVEDPYEFREIRIGALKLFISEKPVWYQYYTIRNLLLLAREHPSLRLSASKKLITELTLVGTLRRDRRKRLRLFARGFVDGVRGVSGKWTLP